MVSWAPASRHSNPLNQHLDWRNALDAIAAIGTLVSCLTALIGVLSYGPSSTRALRHRFDFT